MFVNTDRGEECSLVVFQIFKFEQPIDVFLLPPENIYIYFCHILKSL